jgi:hypothetical protein
MALIPNQEGEFLVRRVEPLSAVRKEKKRGEKKKKYNNQTSLCN